MIKQRGQLYWDDRKTILSDEMFSYMLDENTNTVRYYNALNHFSEVRNFIDPSLLPDFQWIKMEYTVPYFVDLAFRYKSNVYGIIFVSIGPDGGISDKTKWKDRSDMCTKYDIIPSLLVFDENNNVHKAVNDPFKLISALRYKEEGIIEEVKTIEDSSDEFKPMSGFELENMAVMAVVENLHDKENIDEILYQTYPGVYPNIYWIDKNKMLNWMMVQTVNERDLKPDVPKEMLDRISLNRAQGHYALCEVDSPYSPGVYPRGEKFDLKFEITDL